MLDRWSFVYTPLHPGAGSAWLIQIRSQPSQPLTPCTASAYAQSANPGTHSAASATSLPARSIAPPMRSLPPRCPRSAYPTNFASQYAKMLVFADAARELNLENDPRYVLIFQFVRNQILTDALNQHIVQEYSHLPDQQIEDYYKQNPKKYVEATLQRIMVPRAAASGDKPKPNEAEEEAEAAAEAKAEAAEGPGTEPAAGEQPS